MIEYSNVKFFYFTAQFEATYRVLTNSINIHWKNMALLFPFVSP